MHRFRVIAVLAGALAGAAAALPAAATGPTATRIWVSGHGVDQAGCGAPTAPCRSLQFAHDNIASGGEIDILDPAGYGAVTITKSISIVNDGVGTAGVQGGTGGVAINVSAGPTDQVYLRGLNIDGRQGASADGVQFNSGAHLTIADCVVRHFSTEGISLQPTSPTVLIEVRNTVTTENGDEGLVFQPFSAAVVAGVIDHLTSTANGIDGVALQTTIAGGANRLALSNVIASDNAHDGVVFDSNGPNLAVTIDNSELNLNASDGLFASGSAVAHLTRSVLNQNLDDGVLTFGGSALVFTSGSNDIAGNANQNVGGVAMTAEPLQ